MPRNIQTRRTPRTPRAGTPTVGTRVGRHAAQRGLQFATERRRPARGRGRFGGATPGRLPGMPATMARRKRSSGPSGVRGLLGALTSGTQKRSKGSRKGPALLAVLAGLGAAGAGVLKRRRSADDQTPAYVPPANAASTGEADTRAGSA